MAAGLCWTVKAVHRLVPASNRRWCSSWLRCSWLSRSWFSGRQVPPGKPRIIRAVVATAAFLASLAVLAGQVMPLPTVVYGIAMAGANLLVLVGLVTVGLSLRRGLGAHLPLVLGLVTIPALLIGGLAAELVGDQALEVPLVALGVAWRGLGWASNSLVADTEANGAAEGRTHACGCPPRGSAGRHDLEATTVDRLRGKDGHSDRRAGMGSLRSFRAVERYADREMPPPRMRRPKAIHPVA